MDKTAPREQSRACTSSALLAHRFAPDADRLARLLMPALLDRVGEAIIVLGIDHRIWLWNKHAELLYGWSAAEVLGRPLHALARTDGTVFAQACKAVYAHGEWNGEITQPRKDGSMAAAQARWTCLADEQGQPFAIVAIHNQLADGHPARCAEPGMVQVLSARGALLADLHRGLQNDEFTLHYQPQVDAGGIPTGAEALVRWRHPQRGLVPPAEFIPLAEETGLILELDRWVLQAACTQLAAWARSRTTAHLTLAVNMSARQFRHPDFVGYVLAILERTGADPHRLKLEVTEGSLIDDVEETIATMVTLKAHGLGFSLDDFGTGYSSLAYLKRLPLDQLKIDQSFIRDVPTDLNAATIAHAVVTLGQSLGLAVIAEGVETDAQRDFLARHNCDAFQGYLFSPPLPVDQFDAFIASRPAAPAKAATPDPITITRPDVT
jgi:PAS domain S-box-containing protein